MPTFWLAVLAAGLAILSVVFVHAGIYGVLGGDNEGFLDAVFATVFLCFAAPGAADAWIHLARRPSILALVTAGTAVALAGTSIFLVTRKLITKERARQATVRL